jgi:glycine/D-amino acid oxidase-like deaminating enzyme
MKAFQFEINAAVEDGVTPENIPKLLNPSQIQELVPGMDLKASGILGGVYHNWGGRADAIKSIERMAKAAEECGAKFIGNTFVQQLIFDPATRAVVGIKVAGQEQIIRAKHVVLAAGAWTRNLFPVPLANLEHQWVLLQNQTNDLQGQKRHQSLAQSDIGCFDFDSGIYYNDFGGLLGIGNYHHRALLVPDTAIPADKSDAENPFTPNDFAKTKESANIMWPSVKNKRVLKSINGFMSFSKDGYPLVGPVHGHEGLWCITCVWVTHGPGAGRTLAEWIGKGKPNPEEEPYISTVTPQRFPPDFGNTPQIYSVQEAATLAYNNRCALPNQDEIINLRNSKPKIPFIKSAL